MSVVVMGMRMPKTCGSCDFCECFDGYYCGVAQENARILVDVRKERRPDCPLRPLPSEHGRLIDVDEFRNDYNMGEDCKDCKQLDKKGCEYDRVYSKMDFCEWLDNQPVIVPAERKDT